MKKVIAILLSLMLMCTAALADVVITGKTVNVRANPDKDSEKMGMVKMGERYDSTGASSVDDRGVTWYEINYANTTCWVSSKYAELEEDPIVEENPIATDAVAVEDLYKQDLITAAYALNLPEYYRDDTSEVPEQYYNDEIILMGNDRVECINVFAPGYSVYGAQVGMNILEADPLMIKNGLTKIGETDISATFEHVAAPGEAASENGADSCITVFFDEDGVITEFDWSTYTG